MSDDNYDSQSRHHSASGGSGSSGGISLRLSASTHREVASLHNSRSSNRSGSRSQQHHNYHHHHHNQRDDSQSSDESDRDSDRDRDRKRGRSRSRSNSPPASQVGLPLTDGRRAKEVRWTHRPMLVGKKAAILLHFCDACDRPIQSFGRLLPCKHAACRTCAQASKCCPRCQESVHDTEIVSASQLHVCMHDVSASHAASRFGCKRTYLSQRDLLAHIEHRHGGGAGGSGVGAKLAAESAVNASLPPPPMQPMLHQQQQQRQLAMNPLTSQPQQSLPQFLPMPPVPVSSATGAALPHPHHPYQQMLTSTAQQQHQMTFRPPMRPPPGPPGMLPTPGSMMAPPPPPPPQFHHQHQQQQPMPYRPGQMPPPMPMAMPNRAQMPLQQPPPWLNQQQQQPPNRFHGV